MVKIYYKALGLIIFASLAYGVSMKKDIKEINERIMFRVKGKVEYNPWDGSELSKINNGDVLIKDLYLKKPKEKDASTKKPSIFIASNNLYTANYLLVQIGERSSESVEKTEIVEKLPRLEEVVLVNCFPYINKKFTNLRDIKEYSGRQIRDFICKKRLDDLFLYMKQSLEAEICVWVIKTKYANPGKKLDAIFNKLKELLHPKCSDFLENLWKEVEFIDRSELPRYLKNKAENIIRNRVSSKDLYWVELEGFKKTLTLYNYNVKAVLDIFSKTKDQKITEYLDNHRSTDDTVKQISIFIAAIRNIYITSHMMQSNIIWNYPLYVRVIRDKSTDRGTIEVTYRKANGKMKIKILPYEFDILNEIVNATYTDEITQILEKNSAKDKIILPTLE